MSSATQTILEQSNYIALGFRIYIDLCCSPKIEARKILRKFRIKKALRAQNRVFSSFLNPQNGLFPRLVDFRPLGGAATILPLQEHERPLTRLSKTTFIFDLAPTVWPHEASENDAF